MRIHNKDTIEYTVLAKSSSEITYVQMKRLSGDLDIFKTGHDVLVEVH